MLKRIQESSVGNLLMASIEDRPAFGKGGHNTVFELADPRFENYLLRTPSDQLISCSGHESPSDSLYASLSTKTALTPPSQLYTPRNIAQPLAEIAAPLFGKRSIQLMERQPGQTLQQLVDAANAEAGRAPGAAFGFARVMQRLIADGDAALQPLFADWYRLTRHNRKPDSYLANIVYGPDSTCHVIDAFDRAQLIPGNAVVSLAPLSNPVLRRYMDYRTWRFLSRFGDVLDNDANFRDAGEKEQYAATFAVLKDITHTALEKAVTQVERSGPAFAKVKDTRAISLKDSPYDLLDQLETLRAARSR